MNKFYEIYVNRNGWDTPTSFLGIVKVIDEDDDSIINEWCKQNLKGKFVVNNHILKEVWRYKLIDNINPSDRIITTIQRKK